MQHLSPTVQRLVLNPDEIVKYMADCIREVNDVIRLPSTTTRLLLHHFRWDKEKFMERFYDADHQEELFRQAHVVNPFKRSHSYQRQGSSTSHRSMRRQQSASSSSASPSPFTYTTNPMKPESEQTCSICCCTNAIGEMAGLECGHIFCTTCWQYYLTEKIMCEGMSQTISCPAKCDIFVDDKTVLRLIRAPEIRRKYQHLITNSFVECNRTMRWCPGLNCGHAIRAVYSEPAKVRSVLSHCRVHIAFFSGDLYIVSDIVLFSMQSIVARTYQM
jgi:ariadne-1